MIDLRSDTVTQPSAEMREVMARANVGDDVYGEDPSVNQLEEEAAALLGKPSALYVASGTQSNLLALLTHCGRGDEYIVGQDAHTYRFEGGGAAVLGSIQPQPLPFQNDGSIDLAQIQANIKPDDFHFAITRLLCLENTQAGQALSLDYIIAAKALCDQNGLALHLDGARFFNATLAVDVDAATLAAPFDTVSICLSKGLGAPVGSVLIGPTDFIQRARRWRKMLGGGMRQAGIIAAAGRHALTNNRGRLVTDHQHARAITQALLAKFGSECAQQHTNMIHLSLDSAMYAQLKRHLQQAQINVGRPRWVLHLDICPQDVERIVSTIESFALAET